MIDFLNDTKSLQVILIIVIGLSIWMFISLIHVKNLLEDSIVVNARLNTECDERKQKVLALKSQLDLLDESLEKAYNTNAELRKTIDLSAKVIAELRNKLAEVNVAAQPIRKPRRARSRKPQADGQA